MKRRTRVIIAIVRTIARIQGAVLWVQRRFVKKQPAPEAERHLVLMREGVIIRFMHAGFWPDKIIENYGVVGQPSPREQSPARIRDNIMERVDELLEDGYVRLSDFEGAGEITVPVENGMAASVISDFLADRGLGLIKSADGGSVTILASLPAITQTMVSDFLAQPARGAD